MTLVMEILGAIGAVAGLSLYAWKQLKSTPDQKRRKSMQKLDEAFDEAEEHNSTKDLSKWLSKRL